MSTIAKFILIAASFAIYLYTYYMFGLSKSLNWSGPHSATQAGLVAAIAMYLGIFLGCLFRRLRGKNRKISIWKEIKAVVSSSSFWAAVCAAPLVFFSIFLISGDSPTNLSSYILAFQNGFFCEAILEELFPKYVASNS